MRRPINYLDPPTQQAVAHAREIHGRHIRELQDFIRARIGDTQSQCAPVERRRLDSFIDMTLRVRKRYQQEPLEYFYPGLPAIEFYEREEFPWLADLEAATVPMQQELATILREDQAGFAPYIHYDDHMPLDQWRELNHSPRWSAFHFYEKGQPVAERCRRAPATMEVLSRLPQAQVPLRSPSALFSVLQPKTRIPPHTGVANFRLVVHLPLIVPPGCGFRVGGETRAVAHRRSVGVRRHDRARSVERQRADAHHFHLRRLEPAAVAGRARRDRRDHRGHRRLQRHAADVQRLRFRR